MLQRIVAPALLVVALAGCAVQLRTAPAQAPGCDLALGSGRVVPEAQGGLALQGTTGDVMPVLWPFGYSARRSVSGVELLDERGRVVAREGDFVTVGGGTDRNGVFVVCAGSITVVPAPG